MIECLGLGNGEGPGIMALAELDKSSGQDCAFEVEMKLGLGKPSDEGLNVSHVFSLSS